MGVRIVTALFGYQADIFAQTVSVGTFSEAVACAVLGLFLKIYWELGLSFANFLRKSVTPPYFLVCSRRVTQTPARGIFFDPGAKIVSQSGGTKIWEKNTMPER